MKENEAFNLHGKTSKVEIFSKGLRVQWFCLNNHFVTFKMCFMFDTSSMCLLFCCHHLPSGIHSHRPHEISSERFHCLLQPHPLATRKRGTKRFVLN